MQGEIIWNSSKFLPPLDEVIFESLPMSLAKVCSISPNAPAIIFNGEVYTFKDLSERVAGLADEIIEKAILPGPIALVQSVGIDAVASWFACAIAGRPFILLEADHPRARLDELLDASGYSFVLVDDETYPLFKSLPKEKILISDGRRKKFDFLGNQLPSELAIIFPTSGSTGEPKLIAYSTATLQAKVQSSMRLMGVKTGDRVLVAGSHGNYGFLHHVLVFLFSGGNVCLMELKKGGFTDVSNCIIRLGVRHVRFTPSFFRKYVLSPNSEEALGLLEGVRFSGEPLLSNDLKLAQSVLKDNCIIQNIYGSTESALFIWGGVNSEIQLNESNVPIGFIYPLYSYAIQPIDATTEKSQVGELLILSSFHALGDIKNGEITSERFLPINGNSNERVFATGDIVEMKNDGSLIHLGRTNRMVKIRGYRVFLIEIENYLRTISGVVEAVVLEKKEAEISLIYAFITCNIPEITGEIVRERLSVILPDFMIPRYIVKVAHMPLLPGGKVDMNSLMSQIPLKVDFEDNQTLGEDLYGRLAEIWDAVLWNGAHANQGDFLSLGGDSLGLMTLIAEVENRFGKKINIDQFKEEATLRNLAELLELRQPVNDEDNDQPKIRARLFSKSNKQSKGNVIIVPGFKGWAPAFSFNRAEIFQDYDLWSVDFDIEKRNLLQNQQWKIVAREIVELIEAGTIPRPNIIVGFSLGGTLAWLVSRLLMKTSFSPKFVILVDPPRIKRPLSLSSWFLNLKVLKPKKENIPRTLLIQRPKELEFYYNSEGRTYFWNSRYQIYHFLELPTVDHLEMINIEMLRLTKEAIKGFISGSQVITFDAPKELPMLPGVLLYLASKGDPSALKTLIKNFELSPSSFNSQQLVYFLFILFENNEPEKAKEVVSFIYLKWPNSKLNSYIFLRARREVNMLFAEDLPNIFPKVIHKIEYSLAKSIIHNIPKRPFLIRYINLLADLLGTFINIYFFKIRERIKFEMISREV